MFKSFFVLAVVASSLAVVPARAESMACTDANMMKMQAGMDKITDTTKHDSAANEMVLAKASMAKKDEKECMMHMDKIQGMM
jgi:hypothetical protein